MLLNDIAAISRVAPEHNETVTYLDSYNNMLSYLIRILKTWKKLINMTQKYITITGRETSRDFRRKSGEVAKVTSKRKTANKMGDELEALILDGAMKKQVI